MCALPLGATETLAQSTWLYTGTNYGTGANWNTGTVPGAGNTAIFNADGANQPIIAGSFTIGTVNVTAGSLTINSTRTLTVQTAFDISNASVLGAGALSLGAGSTLTASGAGSIGLAPVISGSGATAITGADVTFTGNNTYSGGTTIANGAQLSVGAGGTTGGLGSGATVNDGSLLFNRSNTLAVASAISGSGTVTKLGAGTTQLTGSNSYGGTTTISAGTLSIGSGGTTGTLGTGDVVNNATLLFSRSDDTITIANDISGTGAVTKSNAGTNTTLVLTGNNSYAGTTTITEGTLQIGSGGTTGSLGTGNVVTSGGILRFERSDDISVANNITGTGQLNKQGANALTLTGANTYSGATTIADGTLQIGDGGTAGTLGTGATSNEGSLLFNRSDAFTVSSAISGGGSVSQVGNGTTSLSGVNTYTGTTTISNGTLQLGAGTGSTTATLGSGAIVNDGVLRINRSNAATIANDISGSGALTKTGAGSNTVLTLTGNNSYGGLTTITEGTLRIGDGGTTGSLGSGSVDTSGGTLQFNRSDDISIVNTITGTGGLGKLLDNVLTLTGNNTYSGTTTISAGTLQVGDGGTAGTLGGGNVSNSGDLVFNRSDTITHGGVISGTGNVSQIGSGMTILTGNNTYSGATTITAGTLQIGNGGTTGQLGTGATANDSALVFDRSNALTVASAISGSGTVEQAGGGTTSLSGENAYTGTTTISAGTLSVGAGGTTGSLGSGAVVNNSILQVNRSNDVTVANDISGTGSLTKTTAGTSTVLTLTGNNSYTGTTTITEGTLRIGDGGTTGSLGSGSVNTSGGILQFNRSDDISVANTITGTGQLGKLLDNVLTLTGNNTYSGITTIAAGTLQVGDGGTSGSLGTGGVTNNATLVFNRSDDMTVANVVSGTGNVSQAGSGTTTLTGANTYSGTTTISTGTLQIGAGGGAGQLGTGATTNDGALVINRTGSLAISSSISGTGILTHAGTGTTSLTGTNSFSGTTTIDAGILSIGAGGTAGTLGTGNVVNNATLQVNRSDAIAIANEITGSGDLTKLAAGTATLTGDNSYAGTTTITAGTLQIGDGGITGSLGTGNVAVSGTLAFNRSDDIAIANTISGAGTLAKLGGNTVILTGNNTHSGATTIADGTLQIGSGGTSGQLGTGATTNAGNLLFNRSDALTVASAISGSGSVGQIGSGITSLTGTNTYSGTTTIADGVLSLGAGGSSGTLGTGAVINDATLQFNRTNAFTVDNDISGSGNLSKLLGNTVTLTGSNSYSGTTTISAGTLAIGAGGTTGSLGTGDVVNNATLAFNRSDDIAVANQISGSGGLSKQGTNTLTLTGNNSYTGATSIAVGGALQLGDGGTSGSLGTGTVANAGSLLFNRSDALTVSGAISGIGAVSQIGGGTTVLTGANTYSGGTTIAGGALQIGEGGTTGALGGGATVNDASLLFNRSNAFTVASAISGSGTVTQLGDGTTSLTGANSYTGVTTISGGTLSVGAGGTIGTLGTGDVVNNATLLINRSDAALTIANNLSGSGALTKSAAGTNTVLTLTGNNSYSGLTTITEGTLQIGDGGTSGSLGTGGVNTSGGILRFNRSDDISVVNTISGTGSLAKLLDNVLTLTGDNSYSGTTTISAGTLQVGAGGTSGSLGTGNVANSGDLVFNRSDDVTYVGVISGSGNVSQIGTGTTTLTGMNTYTGITTISNGALQIGAGGTTGSLGTGAVTNDASLVFDRSNVMTVANAISGSGSLAQAGSGTTTLTGSNSYTGTTTIAAGTLVVGAAGTTGTLGTGDVVNDGILQINRSDAALTIANNISGTGALTKTTAGSSSVLTLTGNNSYSGTTTITEGTLQIGDGGTTGSLGTGEVVTTGGVLRFNRIDDISVANTISGTGSLTKLLDNVLTLTGDNSYSGTTTISAGTLQVGAGGTSGSLGTGAVVNIGTLAINRSDDLSIANAISGTGSLEKLLGNVLTLTANNTYSGTTTITTGTLAIGNGGTTGSLGSGAVANDGHLVLDRSNAMTVANDISGSGSVTQLGSGATTLTGDNSYAGTTTIAAGTLIVGAGGMLGTLGLGAVVNEGALQVNRSDNVTIANAISGSGTLTKTNAGTNTVVTLTGNNSYSGLTTIAEGTLQIGAGGTAGSLGTGNVAVTGTLAFNRSDDITVANTISGTGALAKLNGNTVTLTGNNSYSGATTIADGTLQVGSGGGSGTLGTGNVTNNGSLLFNRADALAVPGIISGTGSVGQVGAGMTTLTGNNTYTGTTTIADGTLQIGDGGASGALGSGDVTNSANLVFNRSNGLTVGSAISGTGTVAQIGAGTTSLSGANTYSGTTTISGGTLSIGAGGTSGTLGTGNVANDGTLQINRADAVTIANAISGSGSLAKLVSNTVTLTGNNTYSGTTIIADGTLRIGAGGTTGSLGTGNVVNDAMLEINRSDTVSIANAISGTGGLNHIGSGTTMLTGTSTYSGATSVTSGTLLVDGSIASSSDLTVASGARVGGIGTLPSTTVAAGAFLAPGNAAIGTLQIAGNLTLAPGSTTTIRVNGAQADRVNVTGGAAVSGALQVVALSATFNNPYTVLTATGGRTGSFTSSSVSGSFGAGIVPTVTYDANNVYLSLAPTPIAPVVPSPTPNQAAVAAGLDRAIASGANVSAFFPLYNLPANAVPQALNQISGAVHANVGAMGSLTSGQFTSSLTDPNRASTRVIFDAAVQRATQPSAETCASADSCDTNERALEPVTPHMGVDPLTAWIGALGLVRRVTGDGARTDTAGGVSVGLDKGVMPGTRLGIAFSGGSASSSPDNGLSSIRAEVLQVGTYAQMQTGPWLLNGALSYATMDIISNRQIPVLGQYNVAAQYRTHGLGGRLEGMVDLYGVDGFTFGPSAALQGSIVWNPSFQEWSNGAPAGVSVLAGSNKTARGEIGARVNYFGTVFGLGTSAFARAAYAHYFVRQSNITASLTDLPQGGFALTSGQVDMNAGMLSAGFDVRLNERTTIGLQLETEFSRSEFQAVGGARVRFSF